MSAKPNAESKDLLEVVWYWLWWSGLRIRGTIADSPGFPQRPKSYKADQRRALNIAHRIEDKIRRRSRESEREARRLGVAILGGELKPRGKKRDYSIAAFVGSEIEVAKVLGFPPPTISELREALRGLGYPEDQTTDRQLRRIYSETFQETPRPGPVGRPRAHK